MQNIRFIIRFRGEFMRHVENEGETNKYAENEDVGWGGFLLCSRCHIDGLRTITHNI
jgi:hypothetical protein